MKQIKYDNKAEDMLDIWDYKLAELGMKIFGYLKAFKNYWQTPKGRHDFLDYLRAGIIIFLTAIMVMLILR